MKNNLKVTNLCMSGRINLKRKISVKDYQNLINKCNWDEVVISENFPYRYSKRFNIRKNQELTVHHKVKMPYVTLFHLGGVIIVGLKNKKEGDTVYDLVIKDLKKVTKGLLK